MNIQNAKLLAAIIHYDKGDALRFQHLVKVHGYASAIGMLEKLDEDTQCILEAAAILHDIGIHLSVEKYGSSAGKYQEMEGPSEAEKLMREVGGYTEAQIERVKYLVGHHHTYTNIDGLDYQILVEADFLVNLDENASECDAAQSVYDKLFKTQAGKQILADIFLSI
ncbi:MAG: HD domain-containing protein [Clostridia bacterium]|nr:HD domain-containing protein [Clostridia bacterium]